MPGHLSLIAIPSPPKPAPRIPIRNRFAGAPLTVLARDLLEVDVEDQRRIGRDVGRKALRSVGEVSRNDQLAPAAELPPHDALVPPGNYLTPAEAELEGPTRPFPPPGGVELLAVV